MNKALSPITRRALLQKASALALSPTVAPMGLGLLGMANAAAQTATDYKALVYVFLNGGNDCYNTVVPYDTDNYNRYLNARKGTASADGVYSGIAVVKSKLGPTLLGTRGLSSGQQMALNPTMTGLKSVFDAGRAAIVMNMGLLNRPTNLAEFRNRSVPLPPYMFSHTQTQLWYKGEGDMGWGGQVSDYFLQNNASAALTNINVGGDSGFLVGQQARGYQTTPAGPSAVAALTNGKVFGSAQCAQALQTLISQPSAHLIEDFYAAKTRNALDIRQAVVGAIGTSVPTKFATWFPSASGGNLAAQLQMVARLVEQGPALGMKRQVFIVSMGGFDNHDGLVENHPGLIKAVSDALTQFDNAMVALNMSHAVTAFTGSEFGRQLNNNGNGNDHGWGGHQFVVGGAVNGGRFLGQAPVTGLGHSLDAGGGRLLPTTATEQLSVELGRWFGASDSDLNTIFPNSQYFNLHDLGVFSRP
ncbi:MAG: hypothetical protein RJB34_1718 [Pseudomonadota bacterium]|jgi:uncharacterized protein (DUF1501 family)